MLHDPPCSSSPPPPQVQHRALSTERIRNTLLKCIWASGPGPDLQGNQIQDLSALRLSQANVLSAFSQTSSALGTPSRDCARTPPQPSKASAPQVPSSPPAGRGGRAQSRIGLTSFFFLASSKLLISELRSALVFSMRVFIFFTPWTAF